jgi:hypothetical protein
MGRPRNEKHSADIDAEIRRLEEEKRRLIAAEDQRRGAIVRECLSGKSGDELRDILRPLVAPRDAFLFELLQPRQRPRVPLTGARAGERSANAADPPRLPLSS